MHRDDFSLPAQPPGGAPRLRASWRRSERYGLAADEIRPVFTGSVDTESLLYECGREVLRGLQKTLANEPVSMMITDPDGLVLSRLSEDATINRSLDRVHLAPGFYFAERNVGTNGLGLALADRAPSLVRADEHYCTGLRGYTCAAAPVVDPSGDVAGSVNLTTWSDSAPELLMALAQSAAANTSALMLARGAGKAAPPTPHGEVFRVYADRSRAPEEGLPTTGWRDAFAEARTAFRRGLAVAVVGEPGTGRTALASLARRQLRRERVLSARPPAPEDVESWFELWVPELGKDSTCVIVSGVDSMPAWATTELAQLFARERTTGDMQPYVVTATSADTLPEELRELIDVVVDVPALRFRPDDIMPLARHFAHQARGREIDFTPAAARALTTFDWPGNVRSLRRVVREAAARTDRVDLHHLAPEVFTGPGHPLTRLQSVERDEIVRCLTEPGTTVSEAAERLGLGRATIYRKIRQYRITVPDRTP
ncbi:DNA binding domain-containing protein, excisionase family [Prauserella aidingensis]|uniref:sigma-54-dependent Fis family transcriptional regulator n=1 Tax=Prauserella aidingensis TaxID=387890 RepID=UPI0020A4AEE4|nr:GAF domain-containing protein [Prauserella aidingensis]MCP2252795.1 DNA binding domain-containing protein, excisionase family [Prauserella aidingensis]